MPTTSRTLQTTHRRHQQTNNTLIYSHSTAQHILWYTYWSETYRRIETHLSLFSLPSQLHLGSTDSRPITSWISWPMTSTCTTGDLIVSTDVTQITWLWRWLPLRLSKRQSMSSQTVLLRTTLTRTIVLYLMIWLLGSNQLQFLITVGFSVIFTSFNFNVG